MTDSLQQTLLIVEDEALILQLAVMTLEETGARIIEASNVDEAIRRLEDVETLDGLLTDIQMPGKRDGLDLATYVRNKYPSCAIVLMSGRSLPTDRPRPASSEYLSKPWSTDQLAQVMERQLGLSSTRMP